MAKGPMYVKDFKFSSAGKTVGLCSGGMAKKYATGGQAVQMAKSNAVKKSLAGQKMTKMASGGYYADGGAMRSESTQMAKARRNYDDKKAEATRSIKEDSLFGSVKPTLDYWSAADDLSTAKKETGYAKGGKWIQNAIKKPGALRATLHVKEGKNIPKGKLEAAAAKPGITGKRARLAMTLGKMHKADGGSITEAGTGETYPSRAAMVKHESLETPRMQKQEMIQKSTIKKPAVKLTAGRAASGKSAISPQMPMKKGGFVEGGGMIPNKGDLGVKGNKDPGETGGKSPIKSHPKYNFADGGNVMAPAGALNAMRGAAMQQRPMMAQRPMMPAQGGNAQDKMQMLARMAMAQKMAQTQGRGAPMMARPAMKSGGAAKKK
jgi:hypothetical protein